jgi:hypothetical protein
MLLAGGCLMCCQPVLATDPPPLDGGFGFGPQHYRILWNITDSHPVRWYSVRNYDAYYYSFSVERWNTQIPCAVMLAKYSLDGELLGVSDNNYGSGATTYSMFTGELAGDFPIGRRFIFAVLPTGSQAANGFVVTPAAGRGEFWTVVTPAPGSAACMIAFGVVSLRRRR